MTMVQFIRTHSDAILADWEAFAQTLLPSGEDCNALREAAAELLKAIADDMESKNSTSEPQARQHAADRLAQKFTLMQVLAEYRALRASVNQRWSEQLRSFGPAELAELNLFNTVIDESVARAISWYEARLGHVEDQLSEVTDLSEKRYRSLAELSPDAILVHDGGKWVYANQAAATLMAFDTPQQLIGRSVLEFVLPDYRARADERTRQVVSGKAQPLI